MVEESAIVIVIVVTAVPLELLLVSIVHLLLLVLVLVIATLPGMCKLLLQPANQYILIIIVIIRAVTITMETVWVVAAALSFLLLLQMCPFDQPARCVVTVMQIYSSVSPTLSSTTLNSDNSSSSSSSSNSRLHVEVFIVVAAAWLAHSIHFASSLHQKTGMRITATILTAIVQVIIIIAAAVILMLRMMQQSLHHE